MELDRTSPYAGGDLAKARSFSTLVWLIGTALCVPLVPFYPPTQFGEIGYVILLAAVPAVVAMFVLTRRATRFGELLVVSYVGLLMATVLQVLTGPSAPFTALDLNLTCGVALLHPRGRTLVYVALTIASRIGVACIDGGEIAQAVMESAVWSLLAFTLCDVMRGVREQRLQLHDERNTDALTGLPNRHSFNEAVDAAFDDASGQPLSLLVADLNGFKGLNDRHGHLAGDAALVQVGEVLAGGIRPGDSVYRWGGDEFAVLLPSTDTFEAESVSDRLTLLVAGACTDPEQLTIGIGYAERLPGMDAADLVAAADAMLLAGKRARHAGSEAPAAL